VADSIGSRETSALDLDHPSVDELRLRHGRTRFVSIDVSCFSQRSSLIERNATPPDQELAHHRARPELRLERLETARPTSTASSVGRANPPPPSGHA